MKTLYILCSAIGGTILVVQTILIALGAGADSDADIDPGDLDGDIGAGAGGAHDAHDAHHASDSFLKILSFKTLIAFVTFFGLGGLASAESGFHPVPTLIVSICAGSLALYLVAYLMSLMSRLQSRGNLDIRNAVGGVGRVYLRVPGERAGQGKVTVSVQGRRVEVRAVTPGPEIPTGSEVRIVGTASGGTLEVLPASKE